jgi:hypothetical protein
MKKGARCEQLSQALTRLSADDMATAQDAQRKAIEEAEQCGSKLKASDDRIAVAKAGLDRFRAAPSVAAA